MNPEFPTDPRQALEVSLTAFLLGELPPDQAEFLQKAIAQDQELARMHERLKQTIGLVRETEHKPVEQPAPEPLRLGDDRRQQLLRHFKTVAPKAFAETRERSTPWLLVAAAVVGLLVVAGMLLPALSTAKHQASFSMAARSQSRSQTDVLRETTASFGYKASKTPAPAQEKFGSPELASTPPAPSISAEVPKTTIVLPNDLPETRHPAAPVASDSGGGQKAGDLSLGFGLRDDRAPVTPPSSSAGATVFNNAGNAAFGAATPESSLRQADGSVQQFSRSVLQEGLRNSGDGANAEGLLSVPRVNVAGGGYGGGMGGGGGIGGGLPTPMRPSASAAAPAQALAHNRLVAGLPAAEVPSGISAPAAQSASAGREPETVQELAKAQEPAPDAMMRMRYGLAPKSRPGTEAKAPEGAFPRTESVTAIDPNTGLPVQVGDVNGVTAIDPATGLPMGAEKKDASVVTIDPNTGLPIAAGIPLTVETAVNEAVLRQDPNTGLVNGKPLVDPNTGLPLVAGKEIHSYGARAVGDEIGRVPILGDKPAIGRFYRSEAQTNAPVGFIDQSDTQRLPQLGANFEPAQQSYSIALPQSQVTAGWAFPEKSVPNVGTLGVSTNYYVTSLPQAADNQKAKEIPAFGGLAGKEDAVRAYADAKRQLEDLEREHMKNGSVGIIDRASAEPSESPTLGARLRRALGGEVERKARVKIDRDTQNITKSADQDAAAYDPYFVQTENEVIQSDVVLGKVVDDLKLDQEWAKKSGRGEKLSKAEALQRLRGMMDLKAVPGSSVIEIGVKSDKPEEAARLANEIAQEYQNHRNKEGRKLATAPKNPATLAKNGPLPEPRLYARSSGLEQMLGTNASRQRMFAKLDRIRLDNVSFDGLPLTDVIKRLNEEAQRRDPTKQGINFLVNDNVTSDGTNIQKTGEASKKPDLSHVLVRIVPPLRDVRLADVLDAIVKVADEPIKYKVEDYAVVFSPRTPDSEPRQTRVIPVDRNTFVQGLESIVGFDWGAIAAQASGGDLGGGVGQGGGLLTAPRVNVAGITNDPALLQTMVRQFFFAMGINMNPPNSIYFDNRTGSLVVRASPQDLDTIETAIQVLNVGSKTAQTNSVAQQVDAAPPKPIAQLPVPQPEVDTRENAFSTFSLNVSDVSFKLAAASLEKGALPDPAGIRSEEFINAFDYRDPEAPPGVPVAFVWDRARYPFAQNRDLLRFSIKTAAQGRQAGQPLNLVLLLDNSGSMERADRVQIIREALRVLASQLQPQDKLSVITFARTAQLRFDGVPGNQAGQVTEEVSGLTPQGGTNLEEAMNLAYQTALKHYLANGVNRVVLLTDGAANLGDVEPENLKKKVEDHRKQGIALDCFGIGWEGYNDDLLEVLSRNGDGRYGFINTPEEAATEFAAQLAGALHVAASDVKVQVEFNPKRVTAWRQIGYAKHQLTKEQFRDNTVDAAEIGAAEAGNALYTVEVNPRGEGDLGTVRVRYKIPGTTDYREHEWAVPYNGTAAPLEQSSPAIRLAATASAFSEWLATSPFAAEVSPDTLLGYLSGVPEIYGADARPKKLEWMIRQAKSLAGK